MMMFSPEIDASVLLQPNASFVGTLDGWTLTGMGVMRSLVLLVATGGTHQYIEGTLLRISPPWPCSSSTGWRVSPMHVGAAVAFSSPKVEVYLKPTLWPGLSPMLLVLGSLNLSPPLLAVVSAPTRTPEGKFTFLAEPAPPFNLDHIDDFYIGHLSCPTRVLPGLAPGLCRKISHVDDPVYSMVCQVFLLFCRLHASYDIFRLHYHRRFHLFAADFRVF